jgi:hypothetical protein
MKSFFLKTLLIPFVFIFSSCASIVSKSSWPLVVATEPRGAGVEIKNKKGLVVYKGKTPAILKLKSGAGFFSKESYTVQLSLNGYETKMINLECKINGWYWGNILIGGLIGFLIIDPATGAMYKLDNDSINETLTPISSPSAILNIIDKNNLSNDQQQHLIKIN